MKSTLILLLLVLLCWFESEAQDTVMLRGHVIQNDDKAQQKPYVILISLDGFRWDYVQRFKPPNLSQFIAEGVQAEALIPSFPSKTFINHYSIATGMYPERHGLVDNAFYDKQRDAVYRMGSREMVEDGTWYGGTPIWVQAQQHNIVSASFFFVGSEADVQGTRPTYYYRYNGSIPNQRRVDQVLSWLQLPERERPHVISLYFSDMDDVGHRYGPNNDNMLKDALMSLDTVLGNLFEGLEKSRLPVNVIIVSDHGMMPINLDGLLPIEALEDPDRYRIINNGALAYLYLHEGVQAASVIADLRKKAVNYQVYPTKELPYFDLPPTNIRWGDIIAIPDSGYYFSTARVIGMRNKSGNTQFGEHGFDTGMRDMGGIFYARGPGIRENLQIPAFKNVHVYPLMCHLLGIPVPKDIDGDEAVLRFILRQD